MIGKVPKAGRGFKGIVSYLLRGGKDAPGRDRVAWTDVRNLASPDPELAPALMRATARLNRRCQAPVYHLVISWAHTERATEDIMRQVADRTCADIGLDEMQRLYVAHDDTKHQHLHIVVNRVHPETGKAWNRRQDWVKIERSLADQSREMGFNPIPGRHAEPELYEPKGRSRSRSPHRDRRKELDQVLRPWSDDRVVVEKQRLADLVSRSRSWEDLDVALAAENKFMVRKGQGYVIADKDGCMKSSSLGKAFGATKLDAHFGGARAVVPVLDSEAPDERRLAAFTRAGDAGRDADFALQLYRLGLISLRDLERTIGERQVALDEAVQTLSLAEWVARESARAIAKEDAEEMPRRGHAQSRDRDRDDR